MLFNDDDEFLETELCSAESLHYAWPHFLLLNSRNTLVSSTETSEISIWGEGPLPESLMKGVINPHPFFLWLHPNWPSKGLSQQASLGISAVLCIPQQRYLPCFSKEQKANSCWSQWANSQTIENSLLQLHQKEKQTKPRTQSSVPNRYKMSLQFQGLKQDLNFFYISALRSVIY